MGTLKSDQCHLIDFYTHVSISIKRKMNRADHIEKWPSDRSDSRVTTVGVYLFNWISSPRNSSFSLLIRHCCGPSRRRCLHHSSFGWQRHCSCISFPAETAGTRSQTMRDRIVQEKVLPKMDNFHVGKCTLLNEPLKLVIKGTVSIAGRKSVLRSISGESKRKPNSAWTWTLLDSHRLHGRWTVDFGFCIFFPTTFNFLWNKTILWRSIYLRKLTVPIQELIKYLTTFAVRNQAIFLHVHTMRLAWLGKVWLKYEYDRAVFSRKYQTHT